MPGSNKGLNLFLCSGVVSSVNNVQQYIFKQNICPCMYVPPTVLEPTDGPRCRQSLSPSGPFVVAVTTETVVKDDPVCDPTGSWSLMITGVQLHGCCHGNRTRNVMSGMMWGQIRLLRGGGSWMGGLYGVKQTGATLTPPHTPNLQSIKGMRVVDRWR